MKLLIGYSGFFKTFIFPKPTLDFSGITIPISPGAYHLIP